MKFLRINRNMRPVAWFLVSLFVFLSVGSALSLSIQKEQFVRDLDDHMQREIRQLVVNISDDLRGREYNSVRNYLRIYGEQHEEVYQLKLLSQNGAVLGGYLRDGKAESPVERKIPVEAYGARAASLSVIYDLRPAHANIAVLTAEHIVAVLLFTGGVGAALWFVLRRTAFLPLEQAVAEMNNVNALLEHRVALRTQDWMTANTELRREIAEREAAEEALRTALERAEEEKNKSAAIIAAIGDGISIQDRDYKVLYQNTFHKQLIGDHLDDHCYEAYEKRRSVCPGCPVALSFGDGKVHRAERTGAGADGPVHVEVTASPLRNAAGEIIAGIEVARDITRRKRMEADLRRSNETHAVMNSLMRLSLEDRPLNDILQEALEVILSTSLYDYHSTGGILLADGKKNELAMTVQKGFSRPIREACARVVFGSCLCGRAAATRQVQFSSSLDERHEITHEGIAPHGHYCVPITMEGRTLGVLLLYLEEGRKRDTREESFLQAVAGTLAGLLHRRRMEEERKRMIMDLQALLDTVSAARQEWHETFDSITDMISIHDADHTIIRANKAFARHFNREPKDVVNRKCHELVSPDETQVRLCAHAQLLQGGSAMTEEVSEPGAGRIYRISTFPFTSPGSSDRRIVHVVRDITEEREREMRLIMSERLASLGQMASGIAHEINNPLAAIAGCVDGLNRRIRKDQYEPGLFMKYLGIIKEELTRTKNITTSMLSIVRQKAYEAAEVDINALVERSLEIISFQGRLRRVKVKKQLSPGLPALHGSEGELRQVLLNIITNALDAMGEQGSLTLETGRENETLSIAVSDTGPGITPEHATRIFDPFFTTKSDQGGTGLGLTIANRIVSEHNGSIQVRSAAGKGATVLIALPRFPKSRDASEVKREG